MEYSINQCYGGTMNYILYYTSIILYITFTYVVLCACVYLYALKVLYCIYTSNRAHERFHQLHVRLIHRRFLCTAHKQLQSMVRSNMQIKAYHIYMVFSLNSIACRRAGDNSKYKSYTHKRKYTKQFVIHGTIFQNNPRKTNRRSLMSSSDDKSA